MHPNILRPTILLLGTSNRLQTLTSRSCMCSSILNEVKKFTKILCVVQDSMLFSKLSLYLKCFMSFQVSVGWLPNRSDRNEQVSQVIRCTVVPLTAGTAIQGSEVGPVGKAQRHNPALTLPCCILADFSSLWYSDTNAGLSVVTVNPLEFSSLSCFLKTSS